MLAPAQLSINSSGEIPVKFKLMKVEREQASLPDLETFTLMLLPRSGAAPPLLILVIRVYLRLISGDLTSGGAVEEPGELAS